MPTSRHSKGAGLHPSSTSTSTSIYYSSIYVGIINHTTSLFFGPSAIVQKPLCVLCSAQSLPRLINSPFLIGGDSPPRPRQRPQLAWQRVRGAFSPCGWPVAAGRLGLGSSLTPSTPRPYEAVRMSNLAISRPEQRGTHDRERAYRPSPL
jgi:hypothetical protein